MQTTTITRAFLDDKPHIGDAYEFAVGDGRFHGVICGITPADGKRLAVTLAMTDGEHERMRAAGGRATGRYRLFHSSTSEVVRLALASAPLL
jgi:hypothetical protein